jgi:hypothetical protein
MAIAEQCTLIPVGVTQKKSARLVRPGAGVLLFFLDKDRPSAFHTFVGNPVEDPQ